MISITNKCNNLDKPMEGSRFTFKFVSSLSIRPEKVNVPKGSLYIKSAKWLRYKNVTRNPKILMIDVSNMLLHLQKTVWRNQNNLERVSNIKPFLSVYNWDG